MALSIIGHSLFIINLLLMPCFEVECTAVVHSNMGIIRVEGTNCTVDVNGVEKRMNEKGYVEGINFGIINYYCFESSGMFVSRLECTQCFMTCKQNELISGCNSYGIGYVIGSIIGACIGITAALLMHRHLAKWYILIKFSIISYLQIREDRKTEKIAKMITQATKVETMPNYKNIYKLSDSVFDKVTERRNKKKVLLAALYASMLGTANSCSTTYYLSSSNKICNNGDCHVSNNIIFDSVYGSETCLVKTNGDVVRFKLQDINVIPTYYMAYETAIIKPKVTTHWQCKLLFSSCWNGKCGRFSRHENVISNNTNSDYGCFVDTLGCDEYCIHQTSCTWYRVDSTFDEKYKVYKKESTNTAATLKLTSLGVSSSEVISDTIKHVNVKLMNVTYPVSLINHNGMIIDVPECIIVINNVLYPVTCSDLNMPVKGQIGEVQIDKFGNIIHSDNLIECGQNSCKVECRVKRGPIHSLSKSSNIINTRPQYTHNQLFMKVEFPMQLNMLLSVGITKFDHLETNLGSCEFAVISIFSCSACPTPPHVVLQPINRKIDGQITLDGNCSLTSSILDCNKKMSIFYLENPLDFCIISAMRSNFSRSIAFDYIYQGKVFDNGFDYYSSTSSETASEIFSDPAFYTSITKMTLAFGLGSMILSSITNLIRYWCMTRANN